MPPPATRNLHHFNLGQRRRVAAMPATWLM
jgi:hypothetical protein